MKHKLGRRLPLLRAAYHAFRIVRETGQYTDRLTPNGFRFRGQRAMQDGTFEVEEVAWVQRRLDQADVFIDIGANVGYYSCLARQRDRHVLAVEPEVHNLEILYANLLANGWGDVEVFPLGLGERGGLAQLYGGGTAASLVASWAGSSEEWRKTIPLSTLDVIVGDRFAGQRLLIKLDVEGFEYQVLCGATRTMSRVPAPAWLVEICFSENMPGGVNPNFARTFELFWTKGYRATAVGAGEPDVTPADLERWLHTGRRDFGYVNYAFTRHES